MNILFTGGIGDCLTLESFWHKDTKPDNIFLACPNGQKIKEIFSKLYPQSKIQVLWDDRFTFRCFFNEKGVRKHFGLPKLEDWSIEVQFHEVKRKVFFGSKALTTKLATINTIPQRYIVLVPDSPNQSRPYALTDNDWFHIIEHLEETDTVGVILNCGDHCEVQNDRIIDLTNQTTICESIEILKGASGYIGIDSFMSVLAVQLFGVENIRIKSTNPHLYRHIKAYYAPHTTFPFVGEELFHDHQN